MAGFIAELTSVADTSVVNLNAHLAGARRKDLNILDGERLASTPGNRSLLN
jgi:hypothetical protein